MAVLCWAAYSLLLRAWRSAFGPVARLTLTACGGIVVLVPFTVWEAIAWWPTELSWKSVALVLVAAVIPGAGAYGAYSVMQRTLGAARWAEALESGCACPVVLESTHMSALEFVDLDDLKAHAVTG